MRRVFGGIFLIVLLLGLVSIPCAAGVSYTQVVVSKIIVPDEVYPGDQFTIKVVLHNPWSKAYNVRTQLVISSTDPFVCQGPTLIYVGDLVHTEYAQVLYTILVSGDADAKPYSLGLTVSFYDHDYSGAGFNASIYAHVVSEKIPIKVQGHMEFHLINLPSDLTAEPGDAVTVEADLLLIGTETARFVEVGLAEEQAGPFVSTSGVPEYIGLVDPDSPVPFTLEFSVDSGAETGDHSVQVEVTYWDAYNNIKHSTIEVPIHIEVGVGEGITEAEAGYTLWDWIKILFGIRP